ncbi:MAG TPA: N-acetyltransferase [Pseudobdellovibrionaceae bacterium]|nr:N-acetyltransferase [Pseudobdellovibrionaceae bacterium]
MNHAKQIRWEKIETSPQPTAIQSLVGLPRADQLHHQLRREILLRWPDPNPETWLFTIENETSGERADKDQLIAGLKGFRHWNWFYLTHLWVAPEARHQGLARDLIEELIRRSRDEKLAGVYVDTFDAESLYEKLGFKILGKLANFPEGGVRTWLYLKF